MHADVLVLSDVPVAWQDVALVPDREAGTALLMLERPDKLNALRFASLEGLEQAWDLLERTPWCRTVVVAGKGRAFCSGADVREKRDYDSARHGEFISRGQHLLARIRDSALVSVAALHGYVLGGGLELALSCDLRVAAPDALLGFPEVGLGHLPGWDGASLLAAAVGRGPALHLLLSGERLDAHAAREVGLVDRVVEGAARGEALALARRYAGAPGPVVESVKAAIRNA